MGAIAAGVNAVSQHSTNEYNQQIARETNRSNLDIARENNRTQIELWREQQAHDLDMWERENAYNTPEQQMQRLKDAGVNPLLFAGDTGNATGFPGGQQPPALTTPTMERAVMQPLDFSAMAGDIGQMSQAFKNVQEGFKAKAESGIAGITEQNYRDMALKGFNPEIYKAQVLLQTYSNMRKEGKYITPYMEHQIKKLGKDIDFTDAFTKVRMEEAKKIVEEAKSLKLSNEFNAEAFPKQLEQLTQNLKVQWEQHLKNLQIGDSQVMLNRANAGAADAAAGLAEQQTKTESMRSIIEGFKAGLSKFGINPNAGNLPFYAGLAIKMMTGEVKPAQITDYFKKMAQAEKLGTKALGTGKSDLTNFELYGKPNGLFGSGFNLNTGVEQFFQSWFNSFGLPSDAQLLK